MTAFTQMLAHVTGGRRYCFVIMSFGKGFAFFERIRKLVGEVTGLECIRADDIPTSAETIRDKIHASIDNAALVIADISDTTPNIYYEIGYAAACRKPMIALAAEGKSIPSDLEGIETISYSDSREGWSRFEVELKRHLTVHADSNVSLLRAMIVPTEPSPSYLLASPKVPEKGSRFSFHPKERRTFGDNVGIVGILGAFASVFGEHCAPELLSARHTTEEVLSWDANLFLIGSPKVNPHVGVLLAALQQTSTAPWRFDSCDLDKGHSDYEVILSGAIDNQQFRSHCLHEKIGSSARVEDFGLIIRGPHPKHRSRMVLIMAGPHSLGTAAACLAATRSGLIREIAKHFEGGTGLLRRDATIWTLACGKADNEGHIMPENVSVLGAGLVE